MPNEFPPVIRYESFSDPAVVPDPPPLTHHVARRRSSATTTNTLNAIFLDVEDLRLLSRTYGTLSLASYDGVHGELAPTADERFYFAPGVEVVEIRWRLANGASAARVALELFSGLGDATRLLWTKTLEYDGACPDEGATPFDGCLLDEGRYREATGASRVTITPSYPALDFPEGYLTIAQGPYKLKLTVLAAGVLRRTPSRWLYLDVRLGRVQLAWGTEALVPSTRPEGYIPPARVGELVAEEKTILRGLRADQPGGPSAGGPFSIELPSDAFWLIRGSDTEAEWKDATGYQEHRKLWGEGPRIPLVATLQVLNSEGNGVAAPAALAGLELLWDVEDPDHDKNRADVHDTHLAGMLDYRTGHGDLDPQTSTNCHVDRGGKRGNGAERALPAQTGCDYGAVPEGTFPFRVARSVERPWAATSLVRSGAGDDPWKGRTGVLFQPSRMAGDTYRLRVYVAPQARGRVGRDAPDVILGRGIAPVAETQRFEVWRRVEVLRAYAKTAGQSAIDFGAVGATFARAKVRVVAPPRTLIDAGRYNRAYQAVVDGLALDPQNREKAAAVCDRARDQAPGPWAITFRDWNEVIDREVDAALRALGLDADADRLRDPAIGPAWQHARAMLRGRDGGRDYPRLQAKLQEAGNRTNINLDIGSAAQALAAWRDYQVGVLSRFTKLVLNKLLEGFLREDGIDLDAAHGVVALLFDAKHELSYERAGNALSLRRRLGGFFVYYPTERRELQLWVLTRTVRDTGEVRVTRNTPLVLSLPVGATAVEARWRPVLTLVALAALGEALKARNDLLAAGSDPATAADVGREVQCWEDGHFTAVRDHLRAALTLDVATAHHDQDDRIVVLEARSGADPAHGAYATASLRFGAFSNSLGSGLQRQAEAFLHGAVEGAMGTPVRVTIRGRNSTRGTARVTAARAHLTTAFTAAKAKVAVTRGTFEPVYALTPITAHELGHCLFLAHASPTSGSFGYRHTRGYSCLMNYVPDNEQFCAVCNASLRGWDVGTSDAPRVAVDTTLTPTLALPEPTVVMYAGGGARRVPVHAFVMTAGEFDGRATLRCDTGMVMFYTAAVGGAVVGEFDGDTITGGVVVYAEGTAPGAAPIVLALQDGAGLPLPRRAAATLAVVRVAVDVVPPGGGAALSELARHTTGCGVWVQNAGATHPRAKLTVRIEQGEPKKRVTLRAIGQGGKVRVFARERPTPDAREPERALIDGEGTHAFQATETEYSFWIEGREVSQTANDVRLQVEVEGGPAGGVDHVLFDVSVVVELSADVPVTPPVTKRALEGTWDPFKWTAYTPPLPDNLPARQSFWANGGAEDFAVNKPLVLIAGSVADGLAAALTDHSMDPLVAPILLRASAPAGVRWSVVRAWDDAPDAVAASARPVPTLRVAPSGLDNERVLLADAVGSFHVRAWVDTDGTGVFREAMPAAVLNVVLVQATLAADETAVTSAHCGCSVTPKPEVMLHTQASTKQGFDYGDHVPLHLKARVDLLGGGPDGRRGLDRVFAGWVNNLVTDDAGAGYKGRSNRQGAAVALYLVKRGDALILAPPNDAQPYLDKAPVKDPAGGGILLSTSQPGTDVLSQATPDLATGCRVIVQALDAPSVSWEVRHVRDPSLRIASIWLRVSFRAFLCLWTSETRSSRSRTTGAKLYSVLLRKAWRVNGRYAVNDRGVVDDPGNEPLTVTVTASQTWSPAEPAVRAGVEVRGPTGLAMQTPRSVSGRPEGDPWEAPGG